MYIIHIFQLRIFHSSKQGLNWQKSRQIHKIKKEEKRSMKYLVVRFFFTTFAVKLKNHSKTAEFINNQNHISYETNTHRTSRHRS